MTPEERYVLFDKSISGDLSVEERIELQNALASDPLLKEEYDTYKALNSYLQSNFDNNNQENALKASLDDIGNRYFSSQVKSKNVKVIKMPKWVYAAAACIIVLLGTYLFNPSYPSYNDYAVIPSLALTERGTNPEEVKRAEDLFNSAQYEQASKELQELLSSDPVNSKLKFYYGLSLLEQEKFNEAYTVFEELRNWQSIYKYRAAWFQALGLLKQKRFEESKKVLLQIPEEAEDYKKAQELLNKL